MGYHDPSSPYFASSSVAPYSGGSSVCDPAQTGQYNISPPHITPGYPRGHVAEPYQTYNRPVTGQISYYSLRPGRAPGNVDPPDSSQAFANHSELRQSTHATGGFSDPFSHQPPPSRDPSTHSFGYPPPSQDPSLSDHSRPTTSRGSQPYGPSSSDSWKSKPLPPLPSEPGRPSTGQSIGWEQTPPEHGFRPLVPLPHTRAFSNPDATIPDYGRAYVPAPATTGLTPPSAFPSARLYTPTMPPDIVSPTSHLARSDYQQEEGQRPGHTSPGPVGETQFSMRYGEHYTSPGGLSSPSSISYSEPTGLGVRSPQHPGSVTYSPIEQIRTRFSYDSSVVSGQAPGKRAWFTEEGRSTKRARTDDGHASISLRPSTRMLHPSTHQPQQVEQGAQSIYETRHLQE